MNLAAAAINTNLAHISNVLIYSSMAVYLLAFLAFTAEWTFGGRSRIGRQANELTATPGVTMADSVASAVASAELVTTTAAPTVAVTVTGAGGRTSTLTRTVAAKAGNVDIVTRSDAAPPVDGVGAAGGDDKADRIGRIAVAMTTLGGLLQLGGVIARGVSAGRPPWGNLYEFTCALTLVAVIVFLGLLFSGKDVRWLGLLLTFGVLLGLGLAVTVLYTASEQLVPALHSYWLWIHVSGAMICGGALYAGAIVTIMYLCKDYYEAAVREGRAKDGRWSDICARMPSAASLDKLSYRINALTFPLWTFTIIAGAIWAEAAWGHYWQWDPTETWAFITWVGYACYLHARATAGWKGRKAAWLVLIAFSCFLFNSYGVSIFINGVHSYAGL
ncbi:c-type cytochrome biogenesis protein CcsB [Streptacidiphilus albus]|uniref:c-type cytochrome biogenesis protein CcsB n=1 Tax=Streptacidiphilus albus TaxID=105425 RepID=UPI00054C15A0|nr:c-type cytochrome biogenesis protein CcsB [Streptacidiphilus albus]